MKPEAAYSSTVAIVWMLVILMALCTLFWVVRAIINLTRKAPMPKNILYFTANDCPSCQTIYPKIEKLAQDEGHNLRKINIDEDNKEAVQYGIVSVPAIVIHHNDNSNVIFPANMQWSTVRKLIAAD